jgi:hypothetical protein
MNEQLILNLLKDIKQRLDQMDSVNASKTPPTNNSKFLDLKESALYLKCSVSGVRYKIKTGLLKPTTNGKKLMFPTTVLDKYLRNLNPGI